MRFFFKPETTKRGVKKKKAAVVEEKGLWLISLPSWKEGRKVGEREACFGYPRQDLALRTVD